MHQKDSCPTTSPANWKLPGQFIHHHPLCMLLLGQLLLRHCRPRARLKPNQLDLSWSHFITEPALDTDFRQRFSQWLGMSEAEAELLYHPVHSHLKAVEVNPTGSGKSNR